MCGAMAMGKQVISVLEEFLGQDYVKAMEKNGRFAKELWSD